jgi:serine phosphatase RsbU (regulator of sigma subunit)/DNA-binding transcriptional regulator YiaG
MQLKRKKHMAANARTQQRFGRRMSTMTNEMEIRTPVSAVSARSRLDSWKEIAVYLNRTTRTVQRWERSERLPVHRHFHQKNSSVCAFREEIDAWIVHRRRMPFGLPQNEDHREDVSPPVVVATPRPMVSLVRLAVPEADGHRRSMEREVEAIAKMDRAPKALQFLEDDETSSVLDRRDLVVASEVQRASFPQQPPSIPGLSCTSFCEPARTVGGDYYDFLPLRNGAWGIAIGDVSGKGIGAALIRASLQASLRAQALYARSKIETVMRNVNTLVCKSSPEHFFATLFYAEYQPASRTLKYVNAGHNPPIVLRRSLVRSEVVPLNAGCVPVGVFEDSQYRSKTFQLEAGDVLVAYTDGITESENLTGDPFGHERLERILCGCDGRDPRETLQHILHELSAHSAGCSQTDDMTLLVMKVQNQAAVSSTRVDS